MKNKKILVIYKIDGEVTYQDEQTRRVRSSRKYPPRHQRMNPRCAVNHWSRSCWNSSPLTQRNQFQIPVLKHIESFNVLNRCYKSPYIDIAFIFSSSSRSYGDITPFR